MAELKQCRCCLALGLHKDLNETYIWLNQKEVYAEMLIECFNIVLSPSLHIGNGICESCVSALRAADAFKKTVLHTEQELLKTSAGFCENDEKAVQVKLERDASGDDSDDYFLADAVRETQETKVKVEFPAAPEKKMTAKRSKKSDRQKTKDWPKEDIKDIVAKLATGNNDLTIKKKKDSRMKFIGCSDIKPGSIILSRDGSKPKQSKTLNIVWTRGITRNHQDKQKHRENLITILEYSNVTPFKDKSLLGYICGYCEATFPDPKDLKLHTEDKHKKERLKFKTNFDMTEFNAKFDITNLHCTLCDEKLENLNVLKDHLVNVHGKVIHEDIKDHMLQFRLKKGDVYDCAMCTATYETFKMLKQHMHKHYSNYTCSKCDSSFATRRSLNSHKATHLEGNFKCDHCEKVFPSKAKKLYHEKSKHMGTRNISNCPFCNEPFRSYYQRNQHLIKVHNNEAQYKCNVCNKTYVLKSLLMYHIKKNHLMERNCQCSECGYRFFSNKALKAHMVKHTGERNFTCHICHKAYARKYTLREHMRIHNNDRRFKCDVCAMSFVQKCSLKSHLLSNHGISMAASDITSVNSNVSGQD